MCGYLMMDFSERFRLTSSANCCLIAIKLCVSVVEYLSIRIKTKQITVVIKAKLRPGNHVTDLAISKQQISKKSQTNKKLPQVRELSKVLSKQVVVIGSS